MRLLVFGFIRWCVIVLTTLLFIGVAIVVVKCQDHPKQHKDSIEQQDDMRVMFITIVDKQDDKILYYRTGTKIMQVSFMFWDKQSIFKDKDAKPPYKFKGCFLAIICLTHSYAYWLERMPCSDNGSSFYFSDR